MYKDITNKVLELVVEHPRLCGFKKITYFKLRVFDLVKKINRDELTQVCQENTVNIMGSIWFNKQSNLGSISVIARNLLGLKSQGFYLV